MSIFKDYNQVVLTDQRPASYYHKTLGVNDFWTCEYSDDRNMFYRHFLGGVPAEVVLLRDGVLVAKDQESLELMQAQQILDSLKKEAIGPNGSFSTDGYHLSNGMFGVLRSWS